MSENIPLGYDDLSQMQIEMAIDLYMQNTLHGFICAITLARAADGVLEDIIKKNPSVASAVNEVAGEIAGEQGYTLKEVRDDALNLYANGFKHYDDRLIGLEFNPQQFAQIHIRRAVLDYYKVTRSVTTKMKKFCSEMI